MDNKPKKRGRKPKNSTKSKDYNQIQTDQNDNLIINLKDVSEETNEILPGYVPEESINQSTKSEVCWNCCHSYSSINKSIPVKYLKGVYYMYGEFCSNQCAARHIFDNFEGQEMWETFSLLNLYNNTSKETVEKITPAPSKFKLKMFGGCLSIEEYRELFNEQVTFDINLPPIIPISHNDIKFENKVNPSENKHNLKLYRKSPLNKNNNIYSTMNLETK